MIISNNSSSKIILFIVAVSHFFMPYMITTINIALPAIGSEFSIDAVILNWVASAYLLASAMFLIPFGKLADIYGRKKIFTIGFIVFTVATILAATSTSAFMLILFRFIQGTGGAMISSTAIAIIASVTPLAERGKALGIIVAVVYIGQTAGPLIGGVLTQHFGWRSIFYTLVPLCTVLIVLIFRKIKEEWVEENAEKFNYTSSVIYCVTFLLIMYGLSLVPETTSIVFIILGVLGFLYYLWRENRVKNPLIEVSLFRKNRVFAFSNLAALISYSATYAVIFLLSLYLQYILGLSPQMAGLILMSKAIVQSIFSPAAGSLSDRIDPKMLASAGMALSAIALFMMAFMNTETSLLYVIIALVILGLGIGLFVSPNTNAIMSSVEQKYYGVSSATLATTRSLGQLFSMAIVMLLFALLIGKVEITPLYYDAFLVASRVSFIVFGLLCFLSIFFSQARGSLR